MRGLIVFLADRSRWRQVTGCALWAGFALVFLCLGIEAQSFGSTRLPRAGFRLPPGPNYRPQASRMPEVLNDLAVKYDASMTVLEHSLRSAARTRFWVDLAAAGTCLACLAARWRLGRTTAPSDEPIVPTRTAPARSWRPSLRRPASVPVPAIAEPHEGSFPGGGYAC
jgi:hypothetical protein